MAIHKDFPVQTRYGMVRVTPTQKDHVYVSASLNTPGIHNALTVNGSELSQADAHYYLWADGKWHLGAETMSPLDRLRNLYAKKSILQDATDSQKRKLTEEFDKIVNEWAPINKQALFEAEVGELEYRRERAQKEVDDAEEDLRQKRENLNGITNKLQAWMDTAKAS